MHCSFRNPRRYGKCCKKSHQSSVPSLPAIRLCTTTRELSVHFAASEAATLERCCRLLIASSVLKLAVSSSLITSVFLTSASRITCSNNCTPSRLACSSSRSYDFYSSLSCFSEAARLASATMQSTLGPMSSTQTWKNKRGFLRSRRMPACTSI